MELNSSAHLNKRIDSVIGEINHHHQKQLDLCQRLERVADSLPDNIDRQECLSISWQIYPIVKEAHRFEEETLFPLLTMEKDDNSTLSNSLERLKFEHWEDESSAEDISLSLRQMISEPASANVEKISYMLRGFFEGLRRHIAFETDHLLAKLDNLKTVS
ncbi:MAG: hemerythrin domain-containing protein [Pseudomonadota bacterium]